MDLYETRSRISRKVEEFSLSRLETSLVIRTFTGSGKTTTTLNTIDSLGLRWIYAAPTHDIIQENIKQSEHRHFSFLHLEGRDRCCLRPDLVELAQKGVDIRGFCNDCPFQEAICKYHTNIRRAYSDAPNLAITHSHIDSWLPSFLGTSIGERTMADYYDVIVVDENPIKCLYHDMTMSIAELVYFRECMLLSQLDNEIVRIIEILVMKPIDYDALDAITLDNLSRYDLNTAFSGSVATLFQQGAISVIPKNIIYYLFEIWDRKDRHDLEQMLYYSKKGDPLNICYFKQDALNVGLKILGLDGTATKSVWDHMLLDNVEIFSIDYQYTNAYQLNGGEYPIMSWKHGDQTAIKLCKLIDQITITKKRKVLIVGTKYVNRKIAKFTKVKNHQFATYYNLRSKNEYYKKCDTVILSHAPNPPPEKIISVVSLSGWPEKIWRHIFREEEMLQAIGRLRQNIKYIDDGNIQREKMEIYILPRTGVEKNGNYSELLHEALVISFKNLEAMLNSSGFFDALKMYELLILKECPTNLNEMSKILNVSRYSIKPYFDYLVRNKFIEYEKHGKYRITKEGLERLPIEDQNARSTTQRDFFSNKSSQSVSRNS